MPEQERAPAAPLSVCIAATTFPRWAGDGQGAFIWGLAQALARQGVRIRVVALHTPGANARETIDGVEVWRPRYWWPERYEALRRAGGGLPVTLRQDALARLQLPLFAAVHGAAIARAAHDADLVHAHWTISGAAALAGRRIHRRPVVVTVQGSDVLQIPKLPLGGRFTRAVLSRADQVTSLTRSLQAAVAATGVPASQVEIIPNGVDTTLFAPDGQERSEIVLFVGFLIARKGPRYLLEAAPALLARRPGLRFVLIGDGPEESALRAQAAALGIAGQVDFLGAQPQEVVRRWMRRARLFVLPSLEEGQGVVALEALASGTPVVASGVDGLREVVTPEVGRLVPPADPAALAAAAADLLEHSALWERASAHARRRALDVYDWRRIATRFIQLYENVLQRGERQATRPAAPGV